MWWFNKYWWSEYISTCLHSNASAPNGCFVAEGLDSNNNNNNNLAPLKRKRNPWSAEEGRELFATVQRFREGNWPTMLKRDFRIDRTASQLSQLLFKQLHQIVSLSNQDG
ncbi:uncharacterized protein [Rutidosis leptorrhynchoides]|uniref:uncharacterized protein isoform X2 n=1 Tax=Rutidosis leptorrhynchoides TaxID=125765 RepID=UPI003A98DDEF